MTTPTGSDRSHESVINDTLARILRERLGFSAVAEALVHGKRPDVIVRLPQAAPIVLEIELEPARTVEADALSRFGMEIDGEKVQNAFAVTAPADLRTADQLRLFERLEAATLRWQEWRSDGTSGPKLSGTVAELGNAVTPCDPRRPATSKRPSTSSTRERAVPVQRSTDPPERLPASRRFFALRQAMKSPTWPPSSSSTPCSSKRDLPMSMRRSAP